MSLRAMVQALDFAGADWSPSVQLVAICIAEHADAAGECFPSIGNISRRTRLSPRRVQQIIRQLEREGVLTRTARFRDHRQTSNLYRWTMFLGTILNPAEEPEPAENGAGDSPQNLGA